MIWIQIGYIQACRKEITILKTGLLSHIYQNDSYRLHLVIILNDLIAITIFGKQQLQIVTLLITLLFTGVLYFMTLRSRKLLSALFLNTLDNSILSFVRSQVPDPYNPVNITKFNF
jgi:hypothetical protein